MEVRQNESAVVNQKTRAKTLRSNWTIEKVPSDSRAGNVYRCKPCGFVDIDVVLFLRSHSCAMYLGSVRPFQRAPGRRRHQAANTPIGTRRQPDQGQGDHKGEKENAEFHA